MLDFSDYPRESKFFDHVHKKVIGKMKDKFKGNIINEFVGLNSKKYSIIGVDSREAKQATGANKNGVKSISHKEFLDALFNTKIVRHNMKQIKVNCIKLELMMFVRFLCLVLLTKGTY